MGSDPVTPPNPPKVNQPEHNPFLALLENSDFDTMPYPYPQYTDGPDAESHIRAFVSTWQANHSTQCLTVAEVEASKIAEFTLSLDGPAARWYFCHDSGEFAMFQDVCTQFLKLFHCEIHKRELLRQFYAITQEPHETVSQFTIRFQDLYRPLAQDVSANHL